MTQVITFSISFLTPIFTSDFSVNYCNKSKQVPVGMYIQRLGFTTQSRNFLSAEQYSKDCNTIIDTRKLKLCLYKTHIFFFLFYWLFRVKLTHKN